MLNESQDRCNVFDAIRDAFNVNRTIKRVQKTYCAMMEAGNMYGRGYKVHTILDFIEVKYGSEIRENVSEYLTDMIMENERFGCFVPCERI